MTDSTVEAVARAIWEARSGDHAYWHEKFHKCTKAREIAQAAIRAHLTALEAEGWKLCCGDCREGEA